jgi:hypothetical protein
MFFLRYAFALSIMKYFLNKFNYFHIIIILEFLVCFFSFSSRGATNFHSSYCFYSSRGFGWIPLEGRFVSFATTFSLSLIIFTLEIIEFLTRFRHRLDVAWFQDSRTSPLRFDSHPLEAENSSLFQPPE